MATYIIDRATPADLPLGPLRIEVAAAAGAGAFSGRVSPADAIGSVRSAITVPQLGATDSEFEIVPAAATFPAGSVFTVTVSIDGDPQSHRAVLNDADLSGGGAQALLRFTPRESSIHISTDYGGDTPLEGLAAAAHASVRRVLGVERVDDLSALNLGIVVDSSASMLSRTADGSVRAIVDVLTGVSRVISPRRSVHVGLVGAEITWLDAESDDRAARVVALQEASPLTLGFRSARSELIGLHPDQNTMIFVVTDAVPADIDALAAHEEVEGEGRHVVVLGDGEHREVAGIPITTLPELRAEEGVAGRLEIDGPALDRIVRALLRGCFAPGTAYASRVRA